jgi:flagellar biosynthetic protein FliQ
MKDTDVIRIGTETLLLAAKIGAPVLLTALFTGLFIGMLQSATQLQEPTIAFVPKFIGVGVVLLLSGNWMMATLVTYTQELFRSLPLLIG